MKSVLLFLVVVLSFTGRLAADSVQFSESYTENLKKSFDPDLGDYSYEERSSGAFSVSGSINFPGLSSNRLDEIESFELGIGQFNFSGSVADAFSASSDKLVFKIYGGLFNL